MKQSLGRVAFRFGLAYLRRRYGRQLLIGLGAAVLAVAVAAYISRRDVQEG